MHGLGPVFKEVCKRNHIGQEIPKNLHGGGDNSAITSLLELEGGSTLHFRVCRGAEGPRGPGVGCVEHSGVV